MDDPGTALEVEEMKLRMEFCDAPVCMRNMEREQKEREVEGR